MSPDDRYARCEAVVVGYEGGYVNNPKDPGGATNFGVTQRALSDWRGHPCTVDDVKALGQAEVKAIYRAQYWSAVKGDSLPAGVDLIVFDAAVNTGRGRAAEQLQEGVGGIRVDRVVGPATLAAVTAADAVKLIEQIRKQREAFYRGLATFPEFGVGWLRRLNGVATTSTAWAVKAPPAPKSLADAAAQLHGLL